MRFILCVFYISVNNKKNHWFFVSEGRKDDKNTNTIVITLLVSTVFVVIDKRHQSIEHTHYTTSVWSRQNEKVKVQEIELRPTNNSDRFSLFTFEYNTYICILFKYCKFYIIKK